MTSCRDIVLTGSTASNQYSRWNNICRTCLQTGECRSIFELDECSALSYADKVMHCAGVVIHDHDNLPNRICTQCIHDLNVAYRFRLNCLETNALLQGTTNLERFEETPKVEVPSSPDDGRDQIAIHMDSGVIYTYKPPVGLNVKLTHPSLDNGSESAASNGASMMIMMEDSHEEENMLLPIDTMIPDAKDDEIEYYIYLKDGDDDDGSKAVTPKTKGNAALIKPTTRLQTTSPTIVNSQNNSTEQKRVKTLQTIRKTNRPNEMKPTIETVTTQPATDGTGAMETVIRVKRNLAGPKPSFYCKICDVTYKHKHALDTHMRRHQGDRPYKCEHCDKSFVVPFELQRHARIHTGQKPYKCRYCDRAYSDFGSKTKHERTHTGERPYVCDYCGKSFSYSHVLNSHRLTHTGVKKFGCTICGRRFAKSHHLKSHRNTHRTQSLVATVTATNEDADALHRENNNIKQETTDVIYTALLQDELIATGNIIPMTESTPLLVGHHRPVVSGELVDAYPDNGAVLIPTDWTIVEDAKGERHTDPSVVISTADELENASIVNFNDYMMKTSDLDGFLTEEEDTADLGVALVDRQMMSR
ncbi:zinc finger protein 629-like [Anopheles maculipalpis]|uniref:zinc finger protein 629-like n=1 Tax=Anopheles maculipalpis TaxID=1496333 RepID=UPI002159AA0B|nr:zinc finger protein 629-like [Anopheles maculipalpis]